MTRRRQKPALGIVEAEMARHPDLVLSNACGHDQWRGRADAVGGFYDSLRFQHGPALPTQSGCSAFHFRDFSQPCAGARFCLRGVPE